ncbi:MAG: hypothetical protein WA823_13750 [Candidatus Acidiferrales bacterium]
MNFLMTNTVQFAMVVVGVVIVVVVATAIWVSVRKRKSERLRTQFGAPEYARTVKDTGNQRNAEAALAERNARVEHLQIRALGPTDRARFVESWARVQAEFVDTPGTAVADADRLLVDVMSVRGYPASDFEQRAADISVNHPGVVENYRSAHQMALRQSNGETSTEDLRRAMVHYRSLFEELVLEPARAISAVAS